MGLLTDCVLELPKSFYINISLIRDVFEKEYKLTRKGQKRFKDIRKSKEKFPSARLETKESLTMLGSPGFLSGSTST